MYRGSMFASLHRVGELPLAGDTRTVCRSRGQSFGQVNRLAEPSRSRNPQKIAGQAELTPSATCRANARRDSMVMEAGGDEFGPAGPSKEHEPAQNSQP